MYMYSVQIYMNFDIQAMYKQVLFKQIFQGTPISKIIIFSYTGTMNHYIPQKKYLILPLLFYIRV
jgi:hypothetical protein